MIDEEGLEARWKRHAAVLEPVRRYFESVGIAID
jgi:aspartate aminotransferase-like enzyme